MENTASHRKGVICFILIVLAYLSLIAGTVCIYRLCHLSLTGNRIVQSVSYVVQLCFALFLMKCSGKSFAEFGVTIKKLPLQLLIGVITGGIIAALMFMLGKRVDFSDGLLYIFFSQLLVVTTEEMLIMMKRIN